MHRLGVILPSSNTTVEYEFSRALLGADVSVHYARVPLQEVTVQGLEGMECRLEEAAQLLADANVEAVAFACTSGSLVKGLGYDSKLAKRISEVAHCPALTTSGAVLDALRALNARKICLGTPYLSEVAAKEVEFLEGNGFEVLKEQSLGIKENLKIGQLTPLDAEKLAKTVYIKGVDVVFISCTNFRTFEALPALQTELDVPVISSNSATLWAVLKALNSKAKVNFDIGALLMYQ
jgi:maleate isomerase